MNVPTITMDPAAARAKLKAFRADKHKDAEAIYRKAAEAYELLAEGKPLLQLTAAFTAAGRDERGRPRIAICRADRKEVRFEHSWSHQIEMIAGPFDRNGYVQRNKPAAALDITLPAPEAWQAKRGERSYALTPMVPADVRPKVGQLKDWHVLWEVDVWHDKLKHMVPPRDPLLLRHLEGDLWAVLAQWDLTEVERAILAQQGLQTGASS